MILKQDECKEKLILKNASPTCSCTQSYVNYFGAKRLETKETWFSYV